MPKKLWNMYIEVETLKKFRDRARSEGRAMATILNRLVELYAEGKIKIW